MVKTVFSNGLKDGLNIIQMQVEIIQEKAEGNVQNYYLYE